MRDGEPSRTSGTGLFASIRRLGDTALATVQNRVELLAVELAEEKRWLVETLIWTGAALFFCGLALLTITATIVFLVPANARPVVLIGLCVLYSAVAVFAVTKVRARTKDKEIPLSSTVGELKKDLAWLRSREEE